MIRNGLKNVFRHFKIVGGQSIRLSNLMAVKYNYLAQYSIEDIVNELNQMEAENLVICNNDTIKLTEDGEVFVYGPFSIENGISEFMNIFNHFHVQMNNILLLSNILAVKDTYLSPQSNKYLESIINELESREYIADGGDNRIILTETGFNYLNS